MLSELYEATLKNKEEILRGMEEVKISSEEVNGYWNNDSIDEDSNAIIGAEDGSMNKKEFKGSVLYAVDAEALTFDGRTLSSTPTGEVGVFPRQSFIENRLRLYMSLYEFKVSLKSIKEFNPDLFLLDGSLISELVRSIIPVSYIPSRERMKIEEKYLPKIKSIYSTEEICVKQFRNEIKTEIKTGSEDIRIDPNIYLEYIEYLLSIQQLLEHNPVGISKTSTGAEYFGSEIPSIIIFEKLTRSEGYSSPKRVSIDRALRRLPISHRFFDGLEFTIFYARLEDNAPVLRFEIPGRVKKREIERILSKLKAISTVGYPYLLRKAHNDVIIKNKDIIQISRMLGIIEKTGREIL
ncbi:MAG TPA: DNA double-strand break repair nuclease NurA [Candidatus Altiarchaeales archaeon]|nr:DNA double-strand break repair nuclease NurA [Candidatus Altiarchaeales archaeon]